MAKRLKQPGKIKLLDIKRVWRLIPDGKKPEAVILFIMMFIGMALEMLGAGLVLPIITLVSNPNLIEEYEVFSGFFQRLGSPNKTELMLGAMASLVVIYTIKNTYLALLAWKQSKFIFSTQAEMAKQLFRGYLDQPYTFHLQRNSADLINNLQVELNLFINYMLNPGMLLFAESVVLLGLVCLLIYFEPVGSISVFAIFLIVGGLVQSFTKKRIIRWGRLRQEHEALRMKHAQQGIGAIKDVKVSGTEKFFIDEYEKNSEKSLSMHQKNSFIQNITRLWLEVLTISGLLALSVAMFLQERAVSEIVPVLGLFAAVSFRLMPSISRMVSSINLLRFGSSVTNLIEAEFALFKQLEADLTPIKVKFESAIELVNISFSYPGSSSSALKNVCLSIKKGEMVGVTGASGSGKSTMIDILMGLMQPSEGQLLVDDAPISHGNIKGWQKLIGYVPQTIYLTDNTLRRNIAFGIEDNTIDETSVQKAVELAQLQPLVEELPEGLDTILGERGVRLSGGQRQRVGIARALYHNPEILIFDEATSALDSETEMQVMNAINLLHGTKTIFLIAHRISTLGSVDKLISINNGLAKLQNKQRSSK